MDLHLNLKKEYFEQIKSGEKIEEYRLTTEFWSKRLESRIYENIIFKLGYPPSGDKERTMVKKWKGVTKRTIKHPHFGNDTVEVFVISFSD